MVGPRFGMEYGGFIGCVDDLHFRPGSRNKSLGKAALMQLADFFEAAG